MIVIKTYVKCSFIYPINLYTILSDLVVFSQAQHVNLIAYTNVLYIPLLFFLFYVYSTANHLVLIHFCGDKTLFISTEFKFPLSSSLLVSLQRLIH